MIVSLSPLGVWCHEAPLPTTITMKDPHTQRLVKQATLVISNDTCVLITIHNKELLKSIVLVRRHNRQIMCQCAMTHYNYYLSVHAVVKVITE